MGFLSSLSAGLSAASPFINAGLDYFSAKQQNDMATGQAREAMRFSDAQSAKQMAFQERMSNTSHQREVTDLRAAGLNPLLSLNSGASSPPGAMGTGVNAPVVPELGAAVSSARESMRLQAELRSMSAQAKKANAEGDLVGFERDYAKEHPSAYFMAKFGTMRSVSARAADAFISGLPVGSPGRKAPPWVTERSGKSRKDVPWYERGLGGYKR